MTQQAADILHLYGGEIDPEYSGRGMFGERTVGITFDKEGEFYKAIAEVMQHGDEEERVQVAKALKTLKSDNMGMGYIFY